MEGGEGQYFQTFGFKGLVRKKQVDYVHSNSFGTGNHQMAKALSVRHLIAIACRHMEAERVPKSFGCLPHKSLKLTLHRSKSKSGSNTSSPRTPKSPITPKTSSREDELREVFRHFDSDGDGKISAVELRAYFGSIGEYMSHEEAQGVIDHVDANGDKLIDFEDFMRLMKKEGEKDDDDDDLKAAFEMFEFQKGSGRITPKSLQRVLSRLGDSKTYDECAAMIQVFDVDGNGELDFHEFHQMMA